ncbi:DUF418 domain-containing protein [Sphingomonas radiodurans]|uniref:DUF418 domain-containing protein n=1 Tax=Sphingomonas radiodurans TaxID=2890321 RepID=UPI001E2A0D21|nr:DUF418 domain-containing protein [Sphingomonas radiodurans]WBH16332.1 DUF418 domain-containing protein [Sphingomonas radiodurans]
MSTPAPRLHALDAVRGFAVMGILLLNIVDFAMPNYAYVDPTFYGGATGANWWAWALAFVLAEGKMRGLFTMLFGASTAMIADRALAAGESAARVHYSRMITLFAIGMIHAYLIWWGDILVLYSICGAVVFVAWRWRTQTLLAIASILLLSQLAAGMGDYAAARWFEARATAPDATPELRRKWSAYREDLGDERAKIPAELAAFRGGLREVQSARSKLALEVQKGTLSAIFFETIALMMLGMALYRSGFFSGAWSTRGYRNIILVGYGICLPLYFPIVWWIDFARFDPLVLLATESLHLVLLRPWIALAHAAVIILTMRSGVARWLSVRLAAVGRMAFSNYLGTSIVCTLIFYGYGLGWFGYLDRWQLYPVVLLIWAAMLLWSKPWLDRFVYGPFEWLWRSMARGRVQPFRREIVVD